MKRLTKADIQSFYNSDRAILMFCIGIALIFWLLVKLSQNYKTSGEYEITYSLPQGKTFVEAPLKAVKITLEGQGWDLISNNFRNKISTINFNLSELPAQTFPSNLIRDKIQSILPASIEAGDVNTDYIAVKIENQKEKKVPIILNYKLEFAPRFHQIDSMTLSLDSVIVSGPRSIVENLTEWQTEILVLKDIQASGIYKVPLLKPSNSQLSLNVPEIETELKVEEFTEKDVFVSVLVKNAPDSLKIFPENIKMSFTVGLSNYNKIKSSEFTVEVDLKDIPLNIEKNTIPVLITRQPTYIKNLIFNPKSVEFFFVETAKEETSNK
jgi:YbbR domain-containing protein